MKRSTIVFFQLACTAAIACTAAVGCSTPKPTAVAVTTTASAAKPAAPRPAPWRPAAAVARDAQVLDDLVAAALARGNVAANGPIDDARFVRRIHLDVVGRIPTRAEAEAFLADRAPDKRRALIDRLLASPGYVMHMFNWAADTLRVKDRLGKRPASSWLYQDWLEAQLRENRPWDQLVREMLTADGALADNGAAGFLLRDAKMPLDGVSNLLSTFLGANVACAQCHDHPTAAWTQQDFYEMAAFFGASDGYHEGLKRSARKATRQGRVQADPKELQRALEPTMYALVDRPRNTLVYPDDYKYESARRGTVATPALIAWTDADRKLPSYRIDTSDPARLRDVFAAWMTSPENPRFAVAIGNRLWKKVFGIAVQEPVSDLDDPAAASDPALLAAVGRLVVATKLDLREVQRVFFNTATYQRAASPTPDPAAGAYLFPGPVVRRMTAEQAWDSVVALAAGTRADDVWLRRGAELQRYSLGGRGVDAESLGALVARLRTTGEMGDEAAEEPAEGAAGMEMAAGMDMAAGVDMAAGGMMAAPERAGKPGKPAKPGKAGKRSKVARAKLPLEAMYVGGVPERRFRMVLARASELQQPAPETHFLRELGQSDREVANDGTVDGSMLQALALMNGPVSKLVLDRRSHVMQDVARQGDPARKIEALFVSFLGRAPTAAEKEHTLAAWSDGVGPADLAWVLLNHRGFLFVE